MGNKNDGKSREDLLSDLKRINKITGSYLFLKQTGYTVKFRIDRDVNVFKVLLTTEYIKATIVIYIC